jgi:eukaryotic-like serine/threonine-protein kinase
LALENEALFLRQAVRAGVVDPDKGTAALYVFSQLKEMGAQFTFGQFLVERGLLSNIALSALESSTGGEKVKTISTVGDFKLLELIGEGQNGAVFRATQISLDRPVALKILNSDIAASTDSLERFQHEARATARLNHPNVVHGIAVGTDQGLHYFAMELVEGGSAKELLEKSDGALDEVTALKIIVEAAEGLKAAHNEGLLHRDLKPDNILLTLEGQAKLADLGISQNLTPKPAGAVTSNDFWASPPYVAPEVIRGFADNDPRSDIYSLGATLFELLAGTPPFTADTPEEVMQMHLTSPVPDIQTYRPDVTIQTASLLKRMLAKDVNERVPNAQTVVDGVSRILEMKKMQSTPAEPAPEPAPAPRRAPKVDLRQRAQAGRRGSSGNQRPGQKYGRPKNRGK